MNIANNIVNGRRLRGFLISGECIGAFCRNGKRSFSINSAIPKTATFFTAYFDYSKHVFVCYFEDESFDEVIDGNIIPIVDGPIAMRMDEEEYNK